MVSLVQECPAVHDFSDCSYWNHGVKATLQEITAALNYVVHKA